MIRYFLTGAGLTCTLAGISQYNDPEWALLKKLDSVGQSTTIARHFAQLYTETTVYAIAFFTKKDTGEQQFIHRLETRFGDYFFRSAAAYRNHTPVAAEWKAYFSDTSLSPFQYQLLGINAHINGDIWQALVHEFTLAELLQHRDTYFQFQKALVRQYNGFYDASVNSSRTTYWLQQAGFGLDRLYGQLMLGRWRKRQMQLAILYYTDKKKFNRRLGRVNRKMNRLNALILRHL